MVLPQPRRAALLLPAAAAAAALLVSTGPSVADTAPPPTQPEGVLVWPKPQQQQWGASMGAVDPASFEFAATGANSTILESALRRYRALCFGAATSGSSAVSSGGPVLQGLDVSVASGSLELGLNTSENYTLDVAFPQATLTADTVFGALRGLETFSQLLLPHDDGSVTVQQQRITDWPRFPFRAVMIDSSRHFLPVALIRAHIDAMAYNKMNVLHWHIVDTASFPYVSTAYPALSAKGAYDSNHVYTPQNVERIVRYAKFRGVRVIPEFDSPGHTMPAWGKGGPPDLLTTCGSSLGPLRADRNQTYDFLSRLLTEVAQAFPDQTFHAGGDEVSWGCWGENAEVKAFMKANNMNLTGLNNYYLSRLFQIVERDMKKQDVMVWRPGAADHGVQLPKSLIFDVYSGLEQCPPDGQGCYNITASKTTAAGHRIVRSAGYYLDQLCDLDPDHKHSGNCELNKRHHACHLTQTVACQQTGVISPGGNSMPATRSRAR